MAHSAVEKNDIEKLAFVWYSFLQVFTLRWTNKTMLNMVVSMSPCC